MATVLHGGRWPGQFRLGRQRDRYIIDHGIARYGGLVRTPVGAVPGQESSLELPGHAEFLLLHYAEGDNLYVPVSQADRVGRYIGAGDADPSLTRLGSGEWVRAKAKVRRSVRDMAQELMELYGARAALDGHAYPDDSAWQFELEGSFPYEETPDQAQAILDVKNDMQTPRPMDRLLVRRPPRPKRSLQPSYSYHPPPPVHH